MITTCDADSIWCKRYFLHLNYLCEQNQIKHFNSIVYVPIITNIKYFRSYDLLANWMAMARLWFSNGHSRVLGFVRYLLNASHIPLELFKKIDYFDVDNNCDDTRMGNKLAILDGCDVSIKQVYLPCDNQIPTGNSIYQTFILIWRQTIRWNSSTHEIYYLTHQLLRSMLKIKSYQNFRANPWKILIKLVDNYENSFFCQMSIVSNGIFWALYSYFLNQSNQYSMIYYLLNYIMPISMIIQAALTILFGLYMFTINDENTRGATYHKSKQIIFLIGAIIFSYFVVYFQTVTLFVGWIQTLKTLNPHGESAPKVNLNSAQTNAESHESNHK